MGFAFTGACVGEFVAASRGLGYLLSFAQSTYNSALIFALIFLIMAVVLIIFAASRPPGLERYLPAVELSGTDDRRLPPKPAATRSRAPFRQRAVRHARGYYRNRSAPLAIEGTRHAVIAEGNLPVTSASTPPTAGLPASASVPPPVPR